jgi:hypothetical protein
MTDLISFVRARLTDREVLAKAATNGPWESLDHGDRLIAPYGADGEDFEYVLTSEPAENGDDADYVAAHHPAWTLADIAAKRAIIYAYEFTVAQYEKLIAHRVGTWEAGLMASAEDAVRHIAAIDSSHPDYDETWKP